jgi:hypothetical protein
MQNRVGNLIPTEAEIEKLQKSISDIAQRIAKWSVRLSTDERRALLKFRPGGDKVLTTITSLAERYDVADSDAPIDGMNADMLLARRIAPLTAAVSALAQTLADTELQAQSEAWQAAVLNYALLGIKARNNAGLGGELASVRQFFAIGKRPRNDPGGPTGPAEGPGGSEQGS